jgi:hypothetical protein
LTTTLNVLLGINFYLAVTVVSVSLSSQRAVLIHDFHAADRLQVTAAGRHGCGAAA